MKKTLREQLDRSREIMGLELLNEQALSPCMEISTTVCYEGNIGQPTGTPVQFPCSLVDTQYPTQSLVGEKVQDMGAGYGQGTYEITSVSANPNYTGPTPSNPHLTVHAAWKYPCGGGSCTPGVDCWECTTPGAACQQTTNGTHQSAGACQTACQPPMNDYECVNGQCVVQPGGQFTGPNAQSDCQAVCGNYPNYKCTGNGCIQHNNGQYGGATGLADCQTNCCTSFVSNWGWAIQNPNPSCQQVCAKLNTPNLVNPTMFKHQCRKDWLVSFGCNCQGGSNQTSVSGNFITAMTGHYNNQGCYGQNATTPPWTTNSVCGKKEKFCVTLAPGTPMQQAKCDWLTNDPSSPIVANNCNC